LILAAHPVGFGAASIGAARAAAVLALLAPIVPIGLDLVQGAIVARAEKERVRLVVATALVIGGLKRRAVRSDALAGIVAGVLARAVAAHREMPVGSGAVSGFLATAAAIGRAIAADEATKRQPQFPERGR
jgi:hypothetical protein